jgi:hypothetical protein
MSNKYYSDEDRAAIMARAREARPRRNNAWMGV